MSFNIRASLGCLSVFLFFASNNAVQGQTTVKPDREQHKPIPVLSALKQSSTRETGKTFRIHAFSSETEGSLGSYRMRSSSSNNSAGVTSSPLVLSRDSGDVQNRDSFYVGSRGNWKMWILQSSHSGAGNVDDTGAFSFNNLRPAKIRFYYPDGSAKKTITGGWATLKIKSVDGQYLISARYEPSDLDPDLPRDMWLCLDAPLTGTKVVIQYR